MSATVTLMFTFEHEGHVVCPLLLVVAEGGIP